MDSRVKRQNPAHLQQNKTEKPHHALCLNIATPKSKVARHAACHAAVRLLSGACRVAIFAFGQRCNPAYHGDIMMSTNRVKEFRLARAWSQEQLAEMAALSVRTIQRIENQEQPSLETLSALAAVFEVSVSELSGSTQSEGDEALDQRITEARKQLEEESRLPLGINRSGGLRFTLYPQSHDIARERLVTMGSRYLGRVTGGAWTACFCLWQFDCRLAEKTAAKAAAQ
jgi:transcriptional regulator with XRE-family HTH domain